MQALATVCELSLFYLPLIMLLYVAAVYVCCMYHANKVECYADFYHC